MPTLPPEVAKYAEPVEDIWVVEALPNVCKAVQVLALPKLRPIVLAVAPVYVPEKVSVLSVADKLARLEPRAMPLIVELVK